jgi:hypothetical protein
LSDDERATVNRLCKSQHVKDLQAIVAVGFIGVVATCCIGAGLFIWAETEAGQPLSAATHTFFTFFFAPALAIFGALVTWAYQVGSARLGVVDLFACEISTLCRVVTIADTVHRYVDGVARERTAQTMLAAHKFTSQENYFPVFNNNNRDLQTLESKVVIRITEFYTYMKTFRDAMRMLVETIPLPDSSEPPSSKTEEARREAIRSVVYMLFLGLESARKAIEYLVEFQADKVERIVVILISELEAYRFLRGQYPRGDMHYERLALRDPDYQSLIPDLCALINQNKSNASTVEWHQADLLLPELQKRYESRNETNPRSGSAATCEGAISK